MRHCAAPDTAAKERPQVQATRAAGPRASVAAIVELQRSAGNRAARALGSSPAVAILEVQRGAGNRTARALARAAVEDELYLATRRYSSGPSAADRIAGTGLSNWAVAAGAAVTRRDWAIKQVQEAGGDRSGVLADIYAFLVNRLWGEATDPETGDHLRDEFEGSMNARGRAVFELGEKWRPIESFLDLQLQRRFDESFAMAIARTPPGAWLVSDSDEITRLRTPTQHYAHRMRGDRWGEIIAPGERRGNLHFVDIRRDDAGAGPRPDNTGEFWFWLEGQPLWFYGGRDPTVFQTFVSEYARQVSEDTQLAAVMFPLLIKGFALGVGVVAAFPEALASRIALEIASVVIDDLGSEGVAAAHGEEGKTPWEMIKEGGVQLFLNRVMEFAFGGVTKTQTLGRLGLLEARAAEAMSREIAQAEGAKVATAIEGGGARAVEDPALLDQGYHTEVEVVSEGQHHIYRVRGHGAAARWCRFSDLPLCSLELPASVRQALERAPIDSRLAGALGGMGHALDAAAGAAAGSVARRQLLANVEAAAYYQGQRLGVTSWAEFAAHPTVRRVLGDRLDRLSNAELRDLAAAWKRGEKLAAKIREPVPQPRSRRQQAEDPQRAPATSGGVPTPVQPPRPALVVAGGADPRTAGLGQIRAISRRVTAQGEEEVTIDGYLAEGIKNRSVNAPNYNQDPIWDQLRDAYDLDGWEAAHLWGPGFGDEAAAGMYLAPNAVNQMWQNHGVETFLRRLRARAAQDGAVIRVRATALSYDASVAGGRTLQHVQYEFSAFTPHGEVQLGRVEMSVGKPPAGRVSDVSVTQFSDW